MEVEQVGVFRVKRNVRTMKKNSKAKGNKMNLQGIISLILVLEIIVLLVYICVVRRIHIEGSCI